MIGLAVPPPVLERVYKDIELGEGATVTLVRADGQILARSRDLGKAAAVSLADVPGLRPDDPPSGESRAKAKVDGVERLFRYQKVPDYPLTVIVGQSVDTILAPYHAQRTIYLVAGAVATALLLAFTLLLISRRIDEDKADQYRARLATIVENSSEAIIGRSLDGNILSWNAAAERLFGYSAGEAIGQPITLVMPKDLQADAEKNSAVLQGGGEIPAAEVVRQTKDGRLLSPIRSGAGELIGAAITVRDISERKRTEKALRESEERFRDLAELSSDWFWEQDASLRFTEMSDELYSKTKLRPSSTIGKFRWELPIVGVSDEQWRAHRGVLERHEPFEHFSYKVRNETGEIRWFSISGKPLFGPNGEFRGYRGTGRDITESKRAEESLLQSESDLRRFRVAMDATADAVYLVDRASMRFIDVNEAACRMQKRTREELLALGPDGVLSVSRAEMERTYDAVIAAGPDAKPVESMRQRENGTQVWVEVRRHAQRFGESWMMVTVVRDITARKIAEVEIERLAFYDPLTQLPNRRLLLDRLQHALASSARSGRNGALLFIDLDNFKTLNDTLGHDKGDLLLQQVAQRLATCVREGDTVARLGGDEFVVMLEGLSENPEEAATHAEIVGEKIIAALNQPYLLAGHEHRSTPSIGVTLFGGHQNAIDELLKQADLAMYQSKAAGRNAMRFFDSKMQAMVTDRAALEADLREALRQQQLILYYQAQVVGDGHLTGAEVLVRWQHPQRGIVLPAEFISLAEETGLILPLGNWVLETACAQLAKWAARPNTAHLSLAVNISANQLQQFDFVDQVLAILGSTGANPQKLKLELTESLLVSNAEITIAKMVALKAKGVGFSLDDFGTGYSSLFYLKRLPLDQLKIDKGFVRDILIDINDAAIAKMVVALAESMGLTVIAEGVETEAQRDYLARLGCHAYQGYLFGRPVPLDEFEEFVKRV